MRDADPEERFRSVRRGRRKTLPNELAKLTEGESRGNSGCRRSPQSLKAGPMPYEEQIHELKAAGSSQSSEGEKREALTSMPVGQSRAGVESCWF